jgi:EmrB/QacA subfamily drug resistance transporter
MTDDLRTTPPAPPAPTPRQPVRIIFASLMLVMLLASLDQTIVSTALPTIVGEFGGLEHLSWIVTAYMLATTIATPLYGKLGDLFGRKIVLQAAILLFLLGSALCGISRSMGELIAFRALQGLGGGGLMITTMAAVGDVIPPRDRGRYQGIFGGVFGFSTVLGPLIGGFFVQHLSWRWIFYINLPLGLVAVAVIAWAFASPIERRRPRIDVAGASLLAIGLTALVLFTSLGGHTFAWGSPQILGLIAVSAIAFAAFFRVEGAAAEPILPLSLFRNRTFVVCCATGFIVGLAMFGSITYLPLYLQVVKGVSPSAAGIQLTPMMGGVLVTSIASGQIISRIGRYKAFPIIGTAVMTIGLALLSTLDIRSGPWAASGYALVLGMGLGMIMQVLVLAVQNAVDYRDLGVATSGATLFRSTGGSVGVSLFGAIFAAGLARQLAGHLPAGASFPGAVGARAAGALDPAARNFYLEAFTAALHAVFVAAAFLSAIAFLLTWLLEEIPLRGPARSESIGESFAMPHDATSLEELESILDRLARRESRWDTYRRIADRIGATLQPDEIWLLVQVCRMPAPVTVADLAAVAGNARDDLRALLRRLEAQGFLQPVSEDAVAPTKLGKDAFDDIVQGYRTRLAGFVARWAPEDHEEVRAMLTRFAAALLSEPPAAVSGAHESES